MPWPVHPNGLLGAQGGDNDSYQISRSLRFNPADSAYLSRTPASASNRTVWTYSVWVKRSLLNTYQAILNVFSNTSNTSVIDFTDTNNIRIFNLIGGVAVTNKITSALYRDTSSWMHIVVHSNGASALNLYVNGVQVTAFGTNTGPTADNWMFNSTVEHRIGREEFSTNDYTGCYLTEINWIDGQALTPSSFGETDAITGRWKAKAYSGTYGTNGFYLKFADNSGTTATTLGKDSSPNGNNWTPNNFSVTAGAGNDSLVDSPTNYGSDTGVGGEVRGNYATLNPAAVLATKITLVNGNLQQGTVSGATYQEIPITLAINFSGSNKWYAEVNATTVSGTYYPSIAISSANKIFAAQDVQGGDTLNSTAYMANGQKYNNASLTSYGSAFTSGDVVGIAVDEAAGTVVMYKNNVSQGALASSLTGLQFITVTAHTGSNFHFNAGQRPFAYTAPTGFKALCTQNLTTPTIKKPSSYFDSLAYTGTGASNSISSLGFSPDLVWIKNRGTTTSHAIYDTTRGTGAQLSSNLTDEEVTSSTGLTAFGSNGFTIGTSTLVNTSGTQYVAWAWDEAPIAGMDIVSYTGTGAIRTVAHNLGVAPKMIIAKLTNSAGFQWPVYHSSLTSASSYIWLNSTNAQATDAAYWGTAPTSSVFSVGTNANVNNNTSPYIAYLFAEVEGFSKIGSYVGNGSTDGPFVYCGFRPRWVMLKAFTESSVEQWWIIDTSRSPFNLCKNNLAANSSGSEQDGVASNRTLDILSNGFKLRDFDAGFNYATYSYIFAAFAESPFKYSRAR
jgi:hypothetical protein